MSEYYSIDSRKKRWANFLNISSDTRFVYMTAFESEPDLPEYPRIHQHEWSVCRDYIVKKYHLMLERSKWLHDDTVPYLDLQTGTEIFAEALGCSVFRPDNNEAFALPLIHKASEVGKIKVPELSSSSLAHLFDKVDSLISKAGKDAAIRMVDIQSPMDIAALVWEKSSIYIAMLEEPEAVRELADKARQLLTAFLDEWFKRYGCEFIAHCPDNYVDKGISLSEDEVGAISPQTFEELFLPELEYMSNRYGGLVMHCCANSRHQWGNFRKIPKLKLLNIGQPHTVLAEAYSYFAGCCAQEHGWCGDEEAWLWPGKFPYNAHIVLTPTAKSKEAAVMICSKLHEACGR